MWILQHISGDQNRQYQQRYQQFLSQDPPSFSSLTAGQERCRTDCPGWFEPDSQPDDAVHDEPVSAREKNSEICETRAVAASALLSCLGIPASWPNFPKQSNRKFWARKQGSYYPEQGSHSAPSGLLPPRKS